MKSHVNAIAGRLSLRPPQRRSLEILARSLRSQIATSKGGRGGRRYLPYVFTEQGVADVVERIA